MTDQADDFIEFATARSGPLFRTALLLCGDWHLAEDLVQTSMGRMYQSWRRVQRAGNPAGYARAVLVRTYLSHRRLRRSGERPVAILPDTAGPERDLTLRIVVLAALGQLRPADRAIVILRYWEDMSVADVAAELGLSQGAVRTRSLRALARLRELLADDQLDNVEGHSHAH